MEQLSIFDCLYDKFKLKRKIAVIEMFAGIGSQYASLRNIRNKQIERGCKNPIEIKHHRICEWAIPSILAYASIHRDSLPYYGKDFSKGLSKQDIVTILFDLGVSADYNKPCTSDQLNRMSEDKLRLIYNSIQWENNLVDISRVRGGMLSINDMEYDYILTYSFPCQ